MTLSDLPALNAILNGLSSVFLGLGFYHIRKRNVAVHRKFMLGAFFTSTIFLISYLTYHYHTSYVLKKGPTIFRDPEWFRPIYLAILISHTVLAAAVVPLALVTLWRGLTEKFDRHRKVARWTWPIWMYVSATGVLIYLLLYQIFPQSGPTP